MSYPLGKNSEKPHAAGGRIHPPLYVRGLSTTVYIPAIAPSCFHLGACISASKNVSLPSVPLFHLSGYFLCGYNLVLQLGEFLAPPFPKITNCLELSLLITASLFARQLNCYPDMSPINSNTRVPSLLWLQWELQWELPKFLLGNRHKYLTLLRTEPLFHIYCLLSLPCPFLEYKYFQS